MIAHVDHGKTTLVDALLKQSGIFREGEGRSGLRYGLQRPRKRTGYYHPFQKYGGSLQETIINIVDTPGPR
ncbi:GTP-binding protein [Nostoc commune]|uniref:GTP-binding protein n=1 Tax=Nostoc commune TaxID=1178 RepID=UPI00396AA503